MIWGSFIRWNLRLSSLISDISETRYKNKWNLIMNLIIYSLLEWIWSCLIRQWEYCKDQSDESEAVSFDNENVAKINQNTKSQSRGCYRRRRWSPSSGNGNDGHSRRQRPTNSGCQNNFGQNIVQKTCQRQKESRNAHSRGMITI